MMSPRAFENLKGCWFLKVLVLFRLFAAIAIYIRQKVTNATLYSYPRIKDATVTLAKI